LPAAERTGAFDPLQTSDFSEADGQQSIPGSATRLDTNHQQRVSSIFQGHHSAAITM
jgi:hypothetical protein